MRSEDIRARRAAVPQAQSREVFASLVERTALWLVPAAVFGLVAFAVVSAS